MIPYLFVSYLFNFRMATFRAEKSGLSSGSSLQHRVIMLIISSSAESLSTNGLKTIFELEQPPLVEAIMLEGGPILVHSVASCGLVVGSVGGCFRVIFFLVGGGGGGGIYVTPNYIFRFFFNIRFLLFLNIVSLTMK